ncbi:LuxR C-terminal-related transcriptional regulator [Pantoea agglomerans]|uniref:LuxR C-terminal-related transcriptional regulator n=1 Tax=Enterobacter agglomerans TaxID=549 RepID=UPI003207E4A3
MLNKLCGMRFRKILLVSDDRFLWRGIDFIPEIKKRVECISLQNFVGSDVSDGDIVLLDLLSWQTGGHSMMKSVREFTRTRARLIMITCGIFQELLTDILYSDILKLNRKEMVHFLNNLCGITYPYRFLRTPERKARRFLTRREFEIINAFLTGNKSGTISSEFSINQKTVSTHKLSALSKIGCKNMAHFYIISRPFTCDLSLLFKGNNKTLY